MATFGGLTEEEWNQLARFLGPTIPSSRVNGITVPRNHYPMDRWTPIEDRIDSALSSANGVLNFVLGPVRGFVGAVLHPVVSVADSAVGFAYDLIRELLHDAIDLAYDAGTAIVDTGTWALDQATRLAARAEAAASAALNATGSWLGGVINSVRDELHNLYNAAVNEARAALAATGNFLGAVINSVRDELHTLYNAAVNEARAGIGAAESIAARAVEDLRSWVSTAIGAAKDFALRAVDDLRQWASIAVRDAVGAAEAGLSALERDVVRPIAHELTRFLEGEWKAAAGLLGVVKDAAGWLIFVTTHIVPEVEGTVAWVKSMVSKDVHELVLMGAQAGRAGVR